MPPTKQGKIETPLRRYIKDNPDSAKARAKKRYYKKKDSILEHNKGYRKSHRESMNKYAKKYRDKPETKVKNNIRARDYQSGFRDALIKKVGKCQECNSTNKLELHHEEYKRGSDKVRVLCESCHKRTHRKYFGEIK